MTSFDLNTTAWIYQQILPVIAFNLNKIYVKNWPTAFSQEIPFYAKNFSMETLWVCFAHE